MSYKKQQPKLSETLDVFIDRVEAIEKSILKLEKLHQNIDSKNENFNNEIDRRINLLKQLKFEIDLSKFETEAIKINQNLINVTKESSLILKQEFKTFDKSLSRISKYRFDYFLYFIALLICVSLFSIFFAGKQYAEKKREQEQKEQYMNFIRSNKEVLEIYNTR
ncbi:hypothetical protein SAMN05421738_107190 [Algoriella xinjiangensis]|uniref:Uncharacterized protein n=1 Tax=Algoriella xinjiangensis TaxID=684065 RepID=A0A1I4WUA7_9FLAO|nr:hypothetical protein [Algoriella xinjiangensis]SFN17364.1 hypothetical protein SAMN05421738_107190 [Algoriella xinjiangensis]